MKKYKLFKIFTTIVVITVMSAFSFYLYVGYQFGEATSKASKHIIEIRNEWKETNINPLDTIMRDINKALDSTISTK